MIFPRKRGAPSRAVRIPVIYPRARTCTREREIVISAATTVPAHTLLLVHNFESPLPPEYSLRLSCSRQKDRSSQAPGIPSLRGEEGHSISRHPSRGRRAMKSHTHAYRDRRTRSRRCGCTRRRRTDSTHARIHDAHRHVRARSVKQI